MYFVYEVVLLQHKMNIISCCTVWYRYKNYCF